MAKVVTETFSLKVAGFVNGLLCKIVASSEGKHYVNVLGGGGELTSEQIRMLGNYLLDVSKLIDSDADFKNKK